MWEGLEYLWPKALAVTCVFLACIEEKWDSVGSGTTTERLLPFIAAGTLLLL